MLDRLHLRTFGPLLSLLALVGCAVLEAPDGPRICTEEFRMYYVQVVDASDRPVTGLETTSRLLRTGEVLDMQDDAGEGPNLGYLVATDAHRDPFSATGDAVAFTAESQGLHAEATFTFADDGCHLQKLSGPERIVAEPKGD